MNQREIGCMSVVVQSCCKEHGELRANVGVSRLRDAGKSYRPIEYVRMAKQGEVWVLETNKYPKPADDISNSEASDFIEGHAAEIENLIVSLL